MQANFYQFSKRSNSTKQPTGDGTALEIKLKSDCSIESPVFTLQGFNRAWNYFSWEGSYYFIDDVIYITNDIVEIHGEMDSLATFKSNILGTTAFILYSPNGVSNMIDSRLGITNQPIVHASSMPLTDNISESGTFLITVVGDNSVGTFVISGSDLTNIYKIPSNAEWLATIDTTDTISTISSVFRQLTTMGSSTENIRSVSWIPFDITPDTSARVLYLGNFATDMAAGEIRDRIESHITTIDIPWEHDDWRRVNPYTRIFLYIPFIGNIEIPSADIQNQTSINIKTSINRQNGEISIKVYSGNITIGVFGASTCVTIPIGTANINPRKAGGIMLKDTANMVLTAGMMGAQGAVAGAAQATHDVLGMIEPMPSVIGNVSGDAAVGLGLNATLVTISRDTPDGSIISNKGVMGLPFMHSALISSVGSGYVQTSGASVAGTMTEPEREKINNMLNNGIYIE